MIKQRSSLSLSACRTPHHPSLRMAESALSVVVPPYHNLSGAQETLRSFTDQRRLTDRYAVLAVDNDSTDSTADVVVRFEQRYPDVIVGPLETAVESSYAARNPGSNTRGPMCSRTSTPIRPLAGRGSRMSARRLRPTMSTTCSKRYERTSYTLRTHSGLCFRSVTTFAPSVFPLTCALALRAAVFDAVGPLEKTFVYGGDVEFGRWVHEAGFEMNHNDPFTARHPARTTLRTNIKKIHPVGRGQTRFWRI